MIGFMGFGNYGGPTRIDEAVGLSESDGTKDSPIKATLLGILVPLSIVVLVMVNVVQGRVYWPGGREPGQFVQVYNKFWPVAGTVLLKLGVAGICLAWFGLANWSRTERLCWPVAIAAACAVFVGLCVFVIGSLI